jgi:hypothetical protein
LARGAPLACESEAGAKLHKTPTESTGCIRANRAYIVNYGDRYRNGEPIPRALAESAVNRIVSRRRVKKQQMRWTKQGAQRLQQAPTRALDAQPAEPFGRWYPQMQLMEQEAPVPARPPE